MKNTTQTINTSLIDVTLSVPANFTALHLAHIAWNLYCDTAPVHYKDEFSINDASDFAHYNIHDRIDKAQHYYDSAYTIAKAVKENIDYSVQDAYDYIVSSFRADTIVREDLSFELVAAVEQFVKSKDYADATDWIAEDYLILREQQTAQT